VSFHEPEAKVLRAKVEAPVAATANGTADELGDQPERMTSVSSVASLEGVESSRMAPPDVSGEGVVASTTAGLANDGDNEVKIDAAANGVDDENLIIDKYDNIAYTLVPEASDDNNSTTSTAVPSPKLESRRRAAALSAGSDLKRSASANDVMYVGECC
jgi:hypothetical protein